MTKVIIDGKEIDADPNLTLLQACEMAGAEIPRFCYHERLSIAGNCRMCLVEWVGAPKPQASCALQVKDLRPDRDGSPPKINTATPLVKKAREGVMEFLLINHPLDCPICDQGGECDLQDQSMAYGRAGSRFPENKRAVDEKYMGPLVKTVMTRCIQCTRCVRFMTEVAGVENLGATGRGEDMEVTTYLEEALGSELSANVIDLCPVGALTSKPYAFMARPWELTKTETIDVMDAVGSNIRVDARGREALRVLPRLHEDINEEWISDKTRYAVDGLSRQRLDKPFVRRDGRLKPASWDEAFAAIKARLGGLAGARIAALAGDLQCTEGMFALKSLMEALGSPHLDGRQDGSPLGLKADGSRAPRSSYLFNAAIAGIEAADALLLIGTNPRKEAPIINARIRKAWLQGLTAIARIGEPDDLTYEVCELGNAPRDLLAIAEGRHDAFKTLANAKHPMIILGAAALARADGAAIHRAAARIAEAAGVIRPPADGTPGWNGFSVLHTAAARAGALDIGFLPGPGGKGRDAIFKGAEAGEIEAVILLGADEIDMRRLSRAFKIYIGSHGDAGAAAADVILPAAAYTEKSAIYVNTEGRAQMARAATFPPGEAKEDWAILRALSAVLGKTLPFDSLAECRAKLFAAVPHLQAIDALPAWSPLAAADCGAPGEIGAEPFGVAVRDFYLTNPIARASATMAECSAMFSKPAARAAAE